MANADTLKGADAYSGNALPAAKVQLNSDISKEKCLYQVKNALQIEYPCYYSKVN